MGHPLIKVDAHGVEHDTKDCGVDPKTGYHYCKLCKAAYTEKYRRAHGVKPRKAKHTPPKK
jgi:hypothetical protein